MNSKTSPKYLVMKNHKLRTAHQNTIGRDCFHKDERSTFEHSDLSALNWVDLRGDIDPLDSPRKKMATLIEIIKKYDCATVFLKQDPAYYINYPHVLNDMCSGFLGKYSSKEEFIQEQFSKEEIDNLTKEGSTPIDHINEMEKNGYLLIIESEGMFYISEFH
jgi:hypothetical protein